MSHALKALLAAAAFVATPALAQHHRPGSEEALQKALAGRVAGTPVDCLQLRSIGSSQIIDGRAIIYKVGATLYVNTPRSGASDLDDDDILVTDTHGAQLCSIDTVKLIDRSSHFPRGFVSLGKFVPYTKPRTH
jgi:hypothetical protein